MENCSQKMMKEMQFTMEYKRDNLESKDINELLVNCSKNGYFTITARHLQLSVRSFFSRLNYCSILIILSSTHVITHQTSMQKRRHDIPQGFGFFAFERFMSNNAFSLEGIEKNIEQKCFTLYFIFSLCNKIFFLYKLQFILGAMLLLGPYF